MTLHGPVILSGNAHPQLARDLCTYLGQELGQVQVFEFANENIFVRICENVRERDVFLIQPGARNAAPGTTATPCSSSRRVANRDPASSLPGAAPETSMNR